MKLPKHACLALLLSALAACSTSILPSRAAQVIVFGEQHDQPDHQQQVARVVEKLARADQLGAVVIEMAEQGRSTAGLPRDADAANARAALAWTGWEWPVYEGVVMAAVRAGVPVLGGNLPREHMRAAMGDASQDTLVPTAARDRLAQAVREGHCGLLPAAQEPGMVRIQIARDRSMADVVMRALASGRRVVLLTGGQHASRDRGVPLHLAQRPDAPRVQVVIFGDESLGLRADELRPALVTPRPDPCEGLRERLAKPPAAS
jgi:uncharacterized iron-regulated protein